MVVFTPNLEELHLMKPRRAQVSLESVVVIELLAAAEAETLGGIAGNHTREKDECGNWYRFAFN